MSNLNEIYHTKIKFRFTFWWARWLPLWCHRLIAGYYSWKARRSRPERIYNTEISGTVPGPKTLYAIEVPEDMARRLRTFHKEWAIKDAEVLKAIIDILERNGFERFSNGMSREKTGCIFNWETLAKYESVVDFQLDWHYA